MISSYKKIQVQQDKKPWPINPLFIRRWTAEQKMGGYLQKFLVWSTLTFWVCHHEECGFDDGWWWRRLRTITFRCSWFMYLYLNFRVEQEGQASAPQRPGSFWGSMCCPPNTSQGLTKKCEVRHAIVNAAPIENLALYVGCSHTKP